MKCVLRYFLVYLRISQVLHTLLTGGLVTNALSPLRLQVTVDDAGVRVRTWAWNEGADGTWTKDLGAPTTVLGEGADTVAVGSDTSIGTIAVMKAIPSVEPNIRNVCSTPDAWPRSVGPIRRMPSVLLGMFTNGMAHPSRNIPATSTAIDIINEPTPSNTTAPDAAIAAGIASRRTPNRS